MFFSTGATYVVADPLGGLAGEKVTKFAMGVLHGALEGGGDIASSINAADLAITEQVSTDARLRGAGCTVAAMQVEPSGVSLAWVGDVRVYRLRGEWLACLTHDHSLLNDYIETKRLTVEEIANFPHKNVIVRALGMPNATPDVRSEPREPGDVFVLATSDVYLALGDTLLATVLRRHGGDPDACARALLDDARVNGGSGTVLVVPIRTA
jgi:PPM family protein phosphatase